jgi:hypothetical protein
MCTLTIYGIFKKRYYVNESNTRINAETVLMYPVSIQKCTQDHMILYKTATAWKTNNSIYHLMLPIVNFTLDINAIEINLIISAGNYSTSMYSSNTNYFFILYASGSPFTILFCHLIQKLFHLKISIQNPGLH